MNSSFENIRKAIIEHKPAPLYFLHGEEGFYSDILVDLFDNYLPEDEKAFNYFTLYAAEKDPDDIMDIARRYPMMSEKTIVVVKEVQSVKGGAGKWLNKLAPYAATPSPTTILVVIARGTKVSCKEFTDALKKSGGVVLESQKIKDSDLPSIINKFVKDVGLNIENTSVSMLADNIGNDLSRIYNEIGKLKIVLPKGATITPESIEKNIGISREYNNFELVHALSLRNTEKAFKIIRYFNSNQRDNPWVMTLSAIYQLFSNALIGFYSNRTDAGIRTDAAIWNINALNDCKNCMRNYSPSQIIEIIGLIRQADAFGKGNGSRMDISDIMENLIASILTASGKIK